MEYKLLPTVFSSVFISIRGIQGQLPSSLLREGISSVIAEFLLFRRYLVQNLCHDWSSRVRIFVVFMSP